MKGYPGKEYYLNRIKQIKKSTEAMQKYALGTGTAVCFDFDLDWFERTIDELTDLYEAEREKVLVNGLEE